MPSNAQSGACESSPAERAHGPPRGVEQHSASRGDLTEPESSRSIAPSSLAGRAEGEATAARQVLCARMGFWPFVRRPPSGVCETLVRGQDWDAPSCRGVVAFVHGLSLICSSVAAVTEKSRTPVLKFKTLRVSTLHLGYLRGLVACNFLA